MLQQSRNRYFGLLANAGAGTECYFNNLKWVYIVRKPFSIVD